MSVEPSVESPQPLPPVEPTGFWSRFPVGKKPGRTLYRLFCMTLLAWVTFTQWLLPIRVTGYSMFPTYRDGQINYANRWAYRWKTPERGDVVVIMTTGEQVTILKRIVGMPGERVRMDNGRIYIDGALLEEAYIQQEGGWRQKEIQLGPEEYWAIGDNRVVSEFGIVSLSRLAGRILF